MDSNAIYNHEAEQSVIGAVLIDNDAILFVRELIAADDFYIRRHQWIYETMLDLIDVDKPIDLVTILDELEHQKRLDKVGGSAYLTELMTVTPTSIHAEYYAQIVKRDSIKRQLLDAAGTVAKISHTELTSEDALQQASDAILSVSTKNIMHKPQLVKHFTKNVLDDIERVTNGTAAGIPTGLIDLDKALGGLKGGKLYLLAGRPAMGKSSLGLQMAVNAAKKHHKNVLIFSCEMTGEELTIRVISGDCGLDGQRIQQGQLEGDEWGTFYEACNYVRSWPIYIDDRTRTVEGIKARSILQSATGLDLIVVDYVQRISVSKNYQNRDSEIGAVSDALKSLAMDLQVPVVAISSLNRACESRHNKRPVLSDLRESGNLEYDADVVLFIYRDEVYYPEDAASKNLAEITIAKHRGGGQGLYTVYFQKELTKFTDLAIKSQRLEAY